MYTAGAHVSMGVIWSLRELLVSEFMSLDEHMRGCAECRKGWMLLAGTEWSAMKPATPTPPTN